jgi:glycosyltransferase involved in cell wall biosynthesis
MNERYPDRPARKPRRVLLALSTIFRVRGGIPRFNQMLCLALDALCPRLGLDVTVLSQDDTTDDYLRYGAPWRHARFVPAGGPRGVALRAVRSCLRQRPDLMIIGHVGMTPVGVLCRPLSRRGFAFTAHGVECWRVPRWSRRFSARRARFVLAVSSYTGRELCRETGVRADRIRLLPNTLDPGLDAASGTAPDPGRPPREVLTVSRLWSEETLKGVDHAIEAFARLAPRHPGVRYRIVGKGSDKPRLNDLARALGIEDRVVFEEDLSDGELAERYRRCGVFVLPSAQEGFGIVFLEAMRQAKPCIGGNTGGTPEVVEDGHTGLLVSHGDVAGLESALDRLLSDADLRRRLGEAGRQRLRGQFTFETFRATLERHLQEQLELPAARGERASNACP